MKLKVTLAMAAALWSLSLAGPARAQEKLEKIYVGVAGLSGALAHAFIPKDSGLYEKYGLDVELIFFQGGTQAIQSTLAGGVQMVVTAGPEIIAARVAGSDMTMKGALSERFHRQTLQEVIDLGLDTAQTRFVDSAHNDRIGSSRKAKKLIF